MIPANNNNNQPTFLSKNMLALLLAGLAMLGPFSVDTYLPAFPDIQNSLNTSLLHVQQTLTAYMFAFALMILWHGSLSDAYGRRNVILVSLGVFAVATLGCAASHRVEYLWAFRVLQGLSAGAGVVVGRAIIRDLYEGAEAAKLLSLVTMIFAIAPAIAPILGGWIVENSDWRTIFLCMLAYTIVLGWYSYKKIPETLSVEKRSPFNPHSLFENYKQVFSSAIFYLKAGALAFNFAGLFLYVAAAPVFITQHLHLGADQFAWQFIPSVLGIFIGALAANKLAGRISITKLLTLGYSFLIGAALFNVIYHVFNPPTLPWSVMPLFFYTLGMSLVAPILTLLVIDLFPKTRGTVASCQSFTQTMLAAIVSGVAAPILSASVLWLALGQLAFGLIGLALWMLGRHFHRSQLKANEKMNAWESV
jgi:MFS transporter, DHA1 family, multidrug resistance protein